MSEPSQSSVGAVSSRTGEADATFAVGREDDSAPSGGPSKLEPGTMLGRYEVQDVLGQGGMGEVYEARDPSLERVVAIKLLRASVGASPLERARLLREGQAIAALTHPNIIEIYDAGESEHGVFLAMERLDGTTLRQWGQSRRPSRDVLDVYRAAGRGLAAAHAAGLVHRDFKPANVVLTESGRVVVLDFGLVRAEGWRAAQVGGALPSIDEVRSSDSLWDAQSDARLTRTGLVMGTPAYMAPEQCMGETVDARSDQFSFCVALFEALCGRRPFGKKGDGEDRRGPNLGRLRPPPTSRPIPRRLLTVLRRGLARNPGDRWPSMAALLDALQPSARRAGLWVAVVGMTAAAGGAWAMSQTPVTAPPDCDARSRVVDVWSDAQGQSMTAALRGSGAAYHGPAASHARVALDEWSEQWVVARQHWCVARPDAVAHAAIGACLDAGLRRLALTVEALSEGTEASVKRAPGLVALLDPPAQCAEQLGNSSLADADLLTRAQAVEAQIAQGRVLQEAGRRNEARRVLDAGLGEAEALGRPGPLAQALAAQGLLAEADADYDRALEHYTRAHAEAVTAPRDDLAAEVALRLARLFGRVRTDNETATQWLRHAEAALQRRDDPLIRARFLNTRAAVVGDEDPTLAIALLEEERQLRIALEDEHGLANVDLNRANHEVALGNVARAVELTESGLAKVEALLGKTHPSTARILVNLGAYAALTGDHARARGTLERALEVLVAQDDREASVTVRLNLAQELRGQHEYERAQEHLLAAHADALEMYGSDHPATATVAASLSLLLDSMGELDEAERWAQRSLEARRRIYGEDSEPMARTYLRVGNIARDRGLYAESLVSFERSRASAEKAVGVQSEAYAAALYSIGLSKRELGRTKEALADVERALEIKRATAVNESDLAQFLYVLGRLYWDVGHRREARAAVAEAATLAQQVQGDLGERIARWQRKH